MSKVNVCTEFHQCVYTIPGAYIHYIQHLPFAALDAKDNDNDILTTATIISSDLNLYFRSSYHLHSMFSCNKLACSQCMGLHSSIGRAL